MRFRIKSLMVFIAKCGVMFAACAWLWNVSLHEFLGSFEAASRIANWLPPVLVGTVIVGAILTRTIEAFRASSRKSPKGQMPEAEAPPLQ